MKINTEIPVESLNSVNGIIHEAAPSAVVDVMRQQVRELPLNDSEMIGLSPIV